MTILPASTQPPDEALARRHTPRPVPRDYTLFRECLRWEFGFTCAICLLHERDLQIPGGTESWAVMHIEHIAPGRTSALAATYGNLLYICRLCNGARSDQGVIDAQGRRLLDPTRDCWSSHFQLSHDRLQPHEGDRDAAYTAEAYDINNPRKVGLRRHRREVLAGLMEDLRLFHGRRAAGHALLDEAERLGRRFAAWAPLPEDAPADCRCSSPDVRSLPRCYQRQVLPIEILPSL